MRTSGGEPDRTVDDSITLTDPIAVALTNWRMPWMIESAVPMDVLVIGASVRAASASLLRIGWRPIAFDLFGDVDLKASCGSTRLVPEDYPSKIWEQVRHLRPMPWIYTGAIENHPDVVETLSKQFRLLGNGPETLRGVRDPFRLAEVLLQAGLLAPEVRPTSQGIPTDGSWLEKPVASGGGEGIRPWLGRSSAQFAPVYYQARIAGCSLGATFLRAGGATRLIGVTRQYLGRVGNRFAYRGSLGPWPLLESTRRQVERMGQTIGDSFDLVGIFGIDLIVGNEQAWLIEVNPRYTASVEVLERALGRSIMADHLQAASDQPLGCAAPEPHPGKLAGRFFGKAILFAQRRGLLDQPILIERDDEGLPLVADIPQPGTTFQVGQPIMTVFGQGESVARCRSDLARRIKSWKSRIEVARRRSDLGVDHQENRHRDEEDSQDHPRKPERLD